MKSGDQKRRRLGPRSMAASAVAVMLAACSPVHGAAPAPGAASTGGRVIALNNMSVLLSIFNRDLGHARLVLIFSPT